jgi:hypothetical protein
MNSRGYYPQEYIDSAHDQGYSAYWDNILGPPNYLPQVEKDAWYEGYDKAQAEDECE